MEATEVSGKPETWGTRMSWWKPPMRARMSPGEPRAGLIEFVTLLKKEA